MNFLGSSVIFEFRHFTRGIMSPSVLVELSEAFTPPALRLSVGLMSVKCISLDKVEAVSETLPAGPDPSTEFLHKPVFARSGGLLNEVVNLIFAEYVSDISAVALALARGVHGAVDMDFLDQRVSMVDQVFNIFISGDSHDLVGDDGASEFISEGRCGSIRDLRAEGN